MEKNKNARKIIPNTITTLSIMAGCVSIVLSFQGQLKWAALLIFTAAVLDFFDGFTARLLKACSEFGKNLDSLADMTSFGLAPAILLFRLQIHQLQQFQMTLATDIHPSLQLLLTYSAFLIAIFSALRLARFNTSQSSDFSFTGLSVTPNAILLASLTLWLLYTQNQRIILFIGNPYFLAGISVILSGLLVSRIKMFSLKMRNFRIRENLLQYGFVLISLLLLIFLRFGGLVCSIGLYIVLSLLISNRKAKRDESLLEN